MKIKRILSFLLAAVLLFGFSGCGNRTEDEENSPNPEMTENNELVIYHSSTSLSPMLMEITEKYSAETGKKVSSKLAGTDFLGEMKTNSAAIYIIDTHSDLSEWHSGGLFNDFLTDSSLSSVTDKIHSGLYYSADGIGNYGIPLVLEGYGYIFDREMISAIFGGENAEKLIDDLRTCSFTEFESFVSAVETWIASPSAAKIKIGENEYTFSAEKTGKAENLKGIFSLNSESTRAMEHLMSYALATKFRSRYDVMSVTEEAVSGMEKVFDAYARVLDFHTSHIAGTEGTLGRGEEFTGGDYNYSTSIDLLTRGTALFYPGGTSDTADFEKSSEGFSSNLDIIPMKLPLSDEEITVPGMTAEKLQSSIVIGSRYYIAINPKAEESAAKDARDFVSWLFGSEGGSNAFSGAFGAVPFNFEYVMGESPADSEGSSPADESGNAGQSAESSSAESGSPEGKSSQENNTAPENASPEENQTPEENPDMIGPINPSHNISNSLMSAVAEYYAAGNWIPDLSFALPADFAEKILGEGLSDFWGMENWADSDKKGLVERIIGGWKDRINKDSSAVG